MAGDLEPGFIAPPLGARERTLFLTEHPHRSLFVNPLLVCFAMAVHH